MVGVAVAVEGSSGEQQQVNADKSRLGQGETLDVGCRERAEGD